MMNYYNIHTHEQSSDSGTIEIVNSIVRKDMDNITAVHRSYGIHPWYIYNVEEQIEKLGKYLTLNETVAIGEAGLDKLTDTGWDLQVKAFRGQVYLSEEAEKPLIIHCVKAWAELIALKKDIVPSMPWIIHGFRGKPELAEQLIQQGFWLSFGAKFNLASLQKAWPGHLLAETDEARISIRDVYRLIADGLDLPFEVVASKLAENSNHIFCFLK